MFDDLRGFLDKAQELGELKVIEGASWEEDIGAVTEWQAETPGSPAVLFDKIPGYTPGYRVASNLFKTDSRIAAALGLPTHLSGLDLVRAWRDKISAGYKPVPPVEVDHAPVKENVLTGDKIDLLKFPTPKWHHLDGGRYIGTADCVITRDPEEGWVNLGQYRVMIHDKNTTGIWITVGKHGELHRRKFWAKGQSCPVAICCGQEPILTFLAHQGLPWGVGEYEYGGWLKGKPIQVTRGVATDLPIPASAEIVIEGEIPPPEVETRMEGPFGEWTGHYASGERPLPVVRVKAVLHRTNPILAGFPPTRLASGSSCGAHIQRSAVIWEDIASRVPGVQGVWCADEGGGWSITIVSVKQMYFGHAKQVALAAASGSQSWFHVGWIIVVDEDIDPSNISEVLWAMAQRCDAETGIDIIRDGWTNPLMPAVPPFKRDRGDYTRGVAVVMACKPYYAIDRFPATTRMPAAKLQETKEKWAKVFAQKA